MRRPSSGASITSQEYVYRPESPPTSPIDSPSPESLATVGLSASRALQRIANRGIDVGTVIDVGASNGMWSKICEEHFPKAKYLLIEAQPIHKPGLDEFVAKRPNAEYILAAAGDSVGETYFADTGDPFGGAVIRHSNATSNIVRPMTTLDAEARTRNLGGPYLVKLDTHGFEVPILEGAQQVLKNASIVVIETYTFRMSQDGALLFHEMVAYMADRGFRVVDICEPLWRDKDSLLWQIDIFFQRSDSPEFSYGGYS
jgi:FkbM family methyltransferase